MSFFLTSFSSFLQDPTHWNSWWSQREGCVIKGLHVGSLQKSVIETVCSHSGVACRFQNVVVLVIFHKYFCLYWWFLEWWSSDKRSLQLKHCFRIGLFEPGLVLRISQMVNYFCSLSDEDNRQKQIPIRIVSSPKFSRRKKWYFDKSECFQFVFLYFSPFFIHSHSSFSISITNPHFVYRVYNLKINVVQLR